MKKMKKTDEYSNKIDLKTKKKKKKMKKKNNNRVVLNIIVIDIISNK